MGTGLGVWRRHDERKQQARALTGRLRRGKGLIGPENQLAEKTAGKDRRHTYNPYNPPGKEEPRFRQTPKHPPISKAPKTVAESAAEAFPGMEMPKAPEVKTQWPVNKPETSWGAKAEGAAEKYYKELAENRELRPPWFRRPPPGSVHAGGWRPGLSRAGWVAHQMQSKASKVPLSFGERALGHLQLKGPTAMVVGGMGLAGLASIGAYKKIHARREYKKSYQEMLQAHPSLQHEDPSMVRARFETLYGVAPTVAKDPFASGSVVKQWIEYPTVSPTALQEAAKVEHYAGGGKRPLDAILDALAVFGAGGGGG